jgi:hypothetical protein
MKRLIFSLILLSVQPAFGQTSDPSKTEGLFQITYNSQVHQLEISLNQHTYKEFDSAGALLSKGDFTQIGDNVFSLVPVYSEANSMVQSTIHFSYEELLETGVRVLIANTDNSTQVLEFTRVQ